MQRNELGIANTFKGSSDALKVVQIVKGSAEG